MNSNDTYFEEYCGHQIRQPEMDDPFLVFRSDGNLIGRFDSVAMARKIAKESRIRQLIEELYATIHLQ